MPTKAAKKLHKPELSAKLQRAAAELATGKSIGEVAKLLSLDRSTISEHLNHDLLFIQSYRRACNKITDAAIKSYSDRVKIATDAALDCIINSIKNGDSVRAAWLLDKSKGFTSAVEHAADQLTTAPALITDDLPAIALEIADRQAEQWFDEEGVEELERMTTRQSVIYNLAADLLESATEEKAGETMP